MSIATLLFTCLQCLLSRLTGNPEVVAGLGYDSRMDEEMHGALGLYTKYLPIPGRVTPNATFNQILRRAGKAVSEASEWQEYFTSDLLSGSGVKDETAFMPLCFDFQQADFVAAPGPLRFSIHKKQVYVDRFKMLVSCTDRDDSLLIEFHYDPMCFSDDAIERFSGQFQSVVESISENPQAVIGELNLLNP